MRKLLFRYLIVIVAVAALFDYIKVFADVANIDPSFDTRIPSGFDNTVTTLSTQADGKIIAAGGFTNYQGITLNRIARINADGSRDASFVIGGGFSSTINSLAIQGDGKIIAGGAFTSYSGITLNRIARLSSTGLRDSSFNIGGGFNNTVNTIAIQADGKILVGGLFTSYSGVAASMLVRLSSTGLRDSSFNIGTGFNIGVSVIAVQADGKIIVGGSFTGYAGVAINRIIRLNTDGSRDTSFNMGTGFNNTVVSIAIQADGKILVGGDFTNYAGTAINRIIRLNADGSRDTSFAVGAGLNGTASIIKIQDDGKILVGGTFSTYISVAANRIVRINNNGSRDTSFIMGGGFDNTASTIGIQNDGKIMVGGAFMSYSGSAATRIVRLTTTGTKDTSLNIGNGFDTTVNVVTIQNDGKVLAGGLFTTYGGQTGNRIIRLNADGSKDISLNIGAGFNNTINNIIVQNDGNIVVAGLFTTYNGVGFNRIIRLSSTGLRDTSFNMGGGFNNTVQTTILQNDGKFIVGGLFTTYSGATVNRIVRLSSTGLRDTSFNIGSGFNNNVLAIAVQADGKILVGGDFTGYSGTTVNRIVRLNIDGTIDNTFTIGTGFNSSVNTIVIQNDGKILVGGAFTAYGSSTSNRIIRLNSDGTKDTSFSIGAGFGSTVNIIKLQNDGKILAGGSFSTYNGVASVRIAYLHTNGLKDTGFNATIGFNSTVSSIDIRNGKVFIGGAFRSYNNVAAGYLISLYGDSNIVNLPNTTDKNTISTSFTDKGYIQSNGTLVGSTPISLTATNGNIPTSISIENQNIMLSLPENTQLKQANGTTNYTGVISVPTNKSLDSINNETVISAITVGNPTESIKMTGGLATLLIPVPGKSAGDLVQISYSQDNGVTWDKQIKTLVFSKNGQPYVSFTTNHFTDFAVTIPQGSFSGSFVINNDAQYANTTGVLLKMTANPNPTHMRFSNDGVSRSSWEAYGVNKSWNLSSSTGSKTVYVEFDTNNDTISDIAVNDTIFYDPNINIGMSLIQATLGINTGEISFYKDITTGNPSSTLDIGSYMANLGTINAASSGDHRFEINDMLGLAFAVTIQSSSLTSTNGTIPANNIGYQGSARTGTGMPLTAAPTSAVDIGSTPVTFVARNNTSGLSRYHQDIMLQVLVPAAQAPGSYTGMLTFTY